MGSVAHFSGTDISLQTLFNLIKKSQLKCVISYIKGQLNYLCKVLIIK